MRFGERPTPEPGPGEVQVDIKAASINPIDWKMREGLLANFLKLPMPAILGRDMAGVVLAVGEGVTGFAAGDEVFGMANQLRGGRMQRSPSLSQSSSRPSRAVSATSRPPRSASSAPRLSFPWSRQRGSRPESACSSMAARAASGLFPSSSPRISAPGSRRPAAPPCRVCRSLGADLVIDYSKEDFTTVLSDIDVVFDTMGGDIHRRSWSVMKPGARIVMLAADPLRPSSRRPGSISGARPYARPADPRPHHRSRRARRGEAPYRPRAAARRRHSRL